MPTETIGRNHRFYDIIGRACNKISRRASWFKILADRPLNHGHLVVCRAWKGPPYHIVGEYRLIIDESDKVHVLDHTFVYISGRRYTTRGRCGHAKLPFIPSEW